MSEQVLALDIETAPGKGWEEYEDAALDHHRNAITLVAFHSDSGSTVLTDGEDARALLLANAKPIVTHGGKFDFKTLITKGYPVSSLSYEHDTMLMAVALSHKIPESWLAQYEAKRRIINKELGGHKDVHRAARGYSLKTLAPYFLGVDPFWEVADHNDAAYAALDAKYTYDLYQFLRKELEAEGSWDFYQTKLMPWARMLVRAELRGVLVDSTKLENGAKISAALATAAKKQLDSVWTAPYTQYRDDALRILRHDYTEKAVKAQAKLKTPTQEKLTATLDRYNRLYEAAAEKVPLQMNLNSPDQLKWILKDYYKLDVENFQEDESTGKSVLNRLASEGRKDVEVLLEYRKQSKLSLAFFPSYREMLWKGRLHCGFNLNGARTGRLSSSSPNLQQVPGDLHDLFIAGKGRKVVCYDLSGIEPVVLAYLSECPVLCDILISGGNFHDENVRAMLGIQEDSATIKSQYKKERDLLKEVGLSLLYGAGWRRIQESSQRRGFRWSDKECREKYKRFREKYEAVYEYKEGLDAALAAGDAVSNILGRLYRIEDKEMIHMRGLNTLVQGSASDMLLESARKSDDEFLANNMDATPILFVHDELITDVAEERAVEADRVIYKNLTSWKLPTKYGLIPVNAKGGVDDYWRK